MGRPIDRREFVKTMGAAGALGAMTPAAAAAQGRSSRRRLRVSAAVQPAGRRAARLAISGQLRGAGHGRPAARHRVLHRAQPARTSTALARTLHFPFAIYENIEPIVVPSAADLLTNPPPTLNGTGKGKSRIMPGSYDLLESINVHLYCPVGGAFSLSFTRYTPDGHKLLVCDGIYSVTNNDGRWAIQLASTIVHEVDFIGVTYPDAERRTSAATRTTWRRSATATKRI